MFKVLFPTDFSDNALKALDYATELVDLLSAELTLVHTFSVPSSGGSFISIESHIRKDATVEMEKLVHRVKSRLRSEPKVEYTIRKADTVPLLVKMAGRYDLVIMGTQGASGLKEIFLGSITNAVLKRTTTPVLAIPNGYPYKPIKSVVLSMDNEPLNDQKGIQFIKELIRVTMADLMLFHTEQEAADKGIDPEVYKLFSKAGYSIDYNFSEQSINESLSEMVVDYNVDLLCLVRRNRGLFANIFHSSVTSREAFHTSIPLLVLHD